MLMSFAANAQYTETKDITPLGFSGNFQYVAYGKDNGIIAIADNNCIYTSKDTCKTWNVQKAPIDSIRGLIMAEDQTTGFIYNLYQIYKTVDGGKTWSEHKINGIPEVIDKRRVEYRNFFIKNIDTLFFIVTNRVNGMRIYMSIDSGDNWTEVAKDMDGNSYFSGIANMCFVTSNHGFAFGTAGFYAETQDGGLTWEKHVISHLTYFYDGVKCSDGTMIQVHDGSVPDIEGVKWVSLIESYKMCSVANKIIILDSDGLRTTQDMGNSWIQTEMSTTCNDMVFLSEKTGILVGRNLTSYVTTDCGETWTKYVHGGGEGFAQTSGALYVIDETEFFVGGNTGRLIHSADGGISWGWQDIYTNSLHNIVFPSKDTGYIVSNKGLLKTIDAGKTWIVNSTKGNYQYVEFPTNECGYLGYSSNTPALYKTTNGGLTLKAMYTAVYGDNKTGKEPFSFITETKGLVCADNGNMLYTADGGKTWELKNIGLEENEKMESIVSVGIQGWLLNTQNEKTTRIYYIDTVFNLVTVHEFDEDEGVGYNLKKVNDSLFYIDMYKDGEGVVYFGNFTNWYETEIPAKTATYAYNEHVVYTIDANTVSVYKTIVYEDSLQVSLQRDLPYRYTLFSNVQNVPLNLFLTNSAGEFIWSGQLNSGNGESTLDFPETIGYGSYQLQVEPEKGYYYKTTEPVEIIIDANNTSVKELSPAKGYMLCGNILCIESFSVKLYTITGIEIPITNGVVELQSGIYMLVDGEETYKIVIR